MNNQTATLNFIKEVALYFMDFLETDFHKQRLPKRSVQLRSKDNLLTGLNLNKYPTFNRLIWDLIVKQFDKNRFESFQKGEYRADIPKNLLDVVKIQINKISYEQVATVIDKVEERIQEATALYPNDYELSMNYVADSVAAILKKYVVVPFIQKLEQPLDTLSLGDENITFLMEEELTAVLGQLMESAVSETLKHAIAGEKVDPKESLKRVLEIEEIKGSVTSFFESFKVFDIYHEVYEMSKNKAILDKQEFYLYFCDITYNKIKYPVFYIPFTIEISGNAIAFEFDSQLYINKKALQYITQQYNEERGKFGSLKNITERIIYLAQYDDNLTTALQPILDELIDFFELDSRIDVKKYAPQVARGLYARITNSCYFALFDKADEALVNDYEMILQLLNQGDSVIANAFYKLIEDFIHKNPEKYIRQIGDEWDNKDVPEKLVFKSPIPLNSEQLQIVEAIKKKGCKYITVEGPPGTGKSHTITAIAFNAILDKQNVLILSDKKEALDVVEDKITEAMNKVRIDKNFQNPILRLGKTGNTYSQILSNTAMNDIMLHHRVVQKEYAALERNIEKLSNTLVDELENEIARYGDIDLREVYESIAIEKELEREALPGDFAELLENPAAVQEINAFREIFRKLSGILSNVATTELQNLLRPNWAQKDLNGLHQAAILSKSLWENVKFLEERYGQRIDVITKIGMFSDSNLAVLTSFINRYEKVSSLFASLFKRGEIKRLNSEFKQSFSLCQFDNPRKCIEEIKEIREIFNFSAVRLKSQIMIELPPKFDYLSTIYSVVTNARLKAALETFGQVADDLKYIKDRFSRYDRTFKRIGFDQSSFGTYYDNKLTQEDSYVTRLLRYVSLKQKTRKHFDNLPVVGYANQKRALEELVTVQMTHIMDGRVIDFYDKNGADAVALRDVIRKKKKFPQNQFQKLKEAFPCILAGIRDYAEYIPLEPDIFDLLIIDEASQVSIAQAFPSLLRAKKVLILGDRKQFSNVKAAQARSDTNTEYLNRIRGLFETTISDSPERLVRLEKFNIETSILDFFEYISNYRTQLLKYFRGYKEIISYSNKEFYWDKLQVMKIRGKPIEDVLRFHFVKHDGQIEPIQNTNVLEIEFIIKELQALKGNSCKNSVGIITPHTNQQKLLMDKISLLPDKDYFFDEMRLKIMTFDTCQGEERDIIYYSMVANETEDRLWGIFIKDLNSIDIEDDGKIKAQRLNVGLSRARERMHFVLSKPLDQFTGSIGNALRHYYRVLQEAKLEKSSALVDKKSAMEPKVLDWFYKTEFWNKNKQRIEFSPQFELGKYLKQLDIRYSHPAYRVDFLLLYTDAQGEQHKIIIEYDGFHEHFKSIEGVNELNYTRYYSDEDIYREKVLESYGYKFLRINRFNVGKEPVQTLDKRLSALVRPWQGSHAMVNNIHETIEGLSDGEMKECPKCKKIKGLKEFTDNNLISGIGRICKPCKRKKA